MHLSPSCSLLSGIYDKPEGNARPEHWHLVICQTFAELSFDSYSYQQLLIEMQQNLRNYYYWSHSGFNSTVVVLLILRFQTLFYCATYFKTKRIG